MLMALKKIKEEESIEFAKRALDVPKFANWYASVSGNVNYLKTSIGNDIFKKALKVAGEKGYKEAITFVYRNVPRKIAIKMDAAYLAKGNSVRFKKIYEQGMRIYNETRSYRKAVASMKSMLKRPQKRRAPKLAVPQKLVHKNVDRFVRSINKSINRSKVGSPQVVTQMAKELGSISKRLREGRISDEEAVNQTFNVLCAMAESGIAPASYSFKYASDFLIKNGLADEESVKKLRQFGEEISEALSDKEVDALANIKDKYGIESESELASAYLMAEVGNVFNSQNEYRQVRLMHRLITADESTIDDEMLKDYIHSVKEIAFTGKVAGGGASEQWYKLTKDELKQVKKFIKSGYLRAGTPLFRKLSYIFGHGYPQYSKAMESKGHKQFRMIDDPALQELYNISESKRAMEFAERTLSV